MPVLAVVALSHKDNRIRT